MKWSASKIGVCVCSKEFDFGQRVDYALSSASGWKIYCYMTECLCLGWGLVTLEDRLCAWVGGFGSHSVTWPGNWVHSHEQSVDHASMLITQLQWNLWTLKLRWASGWQCWVCCCMWAPRGQVVLTPREKDNENFLFEAHRFLICVPLPLAYINMDPLLNKP